MRNKVDSGESRCCEGSLVSFAYKNIYRTQVIDKLVNKIRLMSTFRLSPQRLKIQSTFEPQLQRGFASIYRKLGSNVTFSSNRNCLQTLSGNPKPELEKSGTYEVSYNNCDKKYIDQTKRSILVRFTDHIAHARFGRPKHLKRLEIK